MPKDRVILSMMKERGRQSFGFYSVITLTKCNDEHHSNCGLKGLGDKRANEFLDRSVS